MFSVCFPNWLCFCFLDVRVLILIVIVVLFSDVCYRSFVFVLLCVCQDYHLTSKS